MLVGVQLVPDRDFTGYDRLIDLGVDQLSFPVELLDPAWFARDCPGKHRMAGQRVFFEAMAYCARRMPRGAVAGEIIAGIEPVDRTMAAIDVIAALDACPIVSIFRPALGSEMEHWPPPPYDDMRDVMRYVYDACRRHRLPIGAAPHAETSLAVTADDAALLADHDAGFYRYEAWRRMLRLAARPDCSRRMRLAGRRWAA
jgi:hypothetical protein